MTPAELKAKLRKHKAAHATTSPAISPKPKPEPSAATKAVSAPIPQPTASPKPARLSLGSRLRTAQLRESSTPKVKKPAAKIIPAATQAKATAVEEAVLANTIDIEIPDTILSRPEALDNCEGLDADELLRSLGETYTALIKDSPELPSLLQRIAHNLNQYEELHYLLSPEQIGLLFKGLMKVKNVQIKTTKARKSAKSITQQVEQEGGLDL